MPTKKEDGCGGGRNNKSGDYLVDAGFSTAVDESVTTNVVPCDGLPTETRSRECDIVDNDNNTEVVVDGGGEQLRNNLVPQRRNSLAGIGLYFLREAKW